MKQEDCFIWAFAGINSEGQMATQPMRNWRETERVTKQIWKDSQQPNMASKVEGVEKAYGLKDTMSQPFLDKMRKVQRQHNQQVPAVSFLSLHQLEMKTDLSATLKSGHTVQPSGLAKFAPSGSAKVDVKGYLLPYYQWHGVPCQTPTIPGMACGL
ncbi:uncharacterized protein MELLADRAFT_113690 [Melampsora larici-populina 98AG31]|uniref:Uncharacterized protein n=1 Tax=Melampsora larici-populina (strain 98AG31 / pathotype 3-4-7) TaxID=747676 RepID=F4SAS1_MELLP|nr:uncharacterized protein MELLADRAFT_113690 [Melampsora larici-populina 98AG31]EGF98266.1 hypothetical protein MELLADRAFT_113690 [Melampsora larici-populina 98AG31]